MERGTDAGQRTLTRFAWGVLVYTIGVIVWGGFVRASGAGAGCGSHWPLCNGEALPSLGALNTRIELFHRVTSGLALPLVLALLVAARRTLAPGHPARRMAVWSVVFMVTEALIGAGLVLFEYVAYNPSIARAVWMAAHLANTFLLLAALTLTAWAASGGSIPRFAGRRGLAAGAALAGVFVLGISGAVTALGDTLAIHGGLDPADEPVVAMLVGLRLVHPTLACAVALLVAWAVWTAERPARRWGVGVLALFGVQLVVGLINVALRAPVGLQLMHLFVTDLIWIGLVLFAARAEGEEMPAPAAERMGVNA